VLVLLLVVVALVLRLGLALLQVLERLRAAALGREQRRDHAQVDLPGVAPARSRARATREPRDTKGDSYISRGVATRPSPVLGVIVSPTHTNRS
jgi:hypothetical protein